MTLQVQRNFAQSSNAQRERISASAENSSRLARSALFYDTIGTGEVLVERSVSLGLVFTEQPVCMTGVVITGKTVKNKLPSVTAGVWKWQTDRNGYFVGAYLFFVVESAGVSYSLRHSFVFEAEAIKLLAAASLL